MADPFELWVYLSTTPLLWLTVTLVGWTAAAALSVRLGNHPLANPILIAILLVSAVLVATRTPYGTYFEGAQFVHFMLGPATVAIAVPLFRNLPEVRANLLPLGAALAVGSVTGILSAAGLGWLFGLPEDLIASIAPKSVTAGVAMGLSEAQGGEPALTAIVVIATGIFGAVIVTPMMNALGIRDYAARGTAAGLASHGIGTARAFVVDPVAGTFAGVAMGLNALVTSAVLPVLMALFR